MLELRIVLIKWWFNNIECICRCLFDIVILVHGYEQDKTHIDVRRFGGW
jgi:hypothetical protein